MNITTTTVSKTLPLTGSPIYEVKIFADGVSVSKKIILTDNNDAEAIAIKIYQQEVGLLPADPIPNPAISTIDVQLLALDIKKIRSMAEGDAASLATLNAQTNVLRAKRLTLPVMI